MPGPFLVLAVALRQSGVPLTARVQHCKPVPRRGAGSTAGCIAGRHRCLGQARGDTPGFGGERVGSDGERWGRETSVAIAAPRTVSRHGAEQGLAGAGLYLLCASVSLSVE